MLSWLNNEVENGCSNIIANLLGLGSAATPLGLKAFEELQQLNKTQTNKSGHRIALILDDFINVLTSKEDIKQILSFEIE